MSSYEYKCSVYFVQQLVRAAEQTGCISFVLDFLFLFDQAKRKDKSFHEYTKKIYLA